ncbi:hypothetical protein ASPZODRAFT_18727 [Penicilliopsis zonata CBS 506.65]|uniref:Mediator of RNA polymerase II transcription subunit 7 n=1 Tax=Penicilliopsis zonata CBS 506.65 TaxID=1073090 RepID=A0A1L9S9Y0_9EURO|nr:hypothetical protein ASPZODRAFT_18727 [Penicilliopsis zonata CBS 506.65]OJJ43949.1 hypothetical protein ASPZODRAFT_18727 [Penicilliopsis zonata CBS 506.65]
MAEIGQQRAVTAAFTPPPPMWKHFTTDNLNKLEEIKKQALQAEEGKAKGKKWTPAELRALDLPGELRFLAPPAVPTSGHYSVFGELQSLSTVFPSLQEQGIEQLYPSPPTDADSASKPTPPLNHAYYLLKISKSLLLNFLEFVGVLSVAPEQFQAKVEDLRNLFINAHHLLNLYRPHQARESLIMMMEEQLERTREEIKEMDRVKLEIETALEQWKLEGREASAANKSTAESLPPAGAEEKNTEDSRLLWDILKHDN